MQDVKDLFKLSFNYKRPQGDVESYLNIKSIIKLKNNAFKQKASIAFFNKILILVNSLSQTIHQALLWMSFYLLGDITEGTSVVPGTEYIVIFVVYPTYMIGMCLLENYLHI